MPELFPEPKSKHNQLNKINKRRVKCSKAADSAPRTDMTGPDNNVERSPPHHNWVDWHHMHVLETYQKPQSWVSLSLQQKFINNYAAGSASCKKDQTCSRHVVGFIEQ